MKGSNNISPYVNIGVLRVEHREFAFMQTIEGINVVFVITDDDLRTHPKLNGFIDGKELSPGGSLLGTRQRGKKGLLRLGLETLLLGALFSTLTITPTVGPAKQTAHMCGIASIATRTFVGVTHVRIFTLVNLCVPEFVMYADHSIASLERVSQS